MTTDLRERVCMVTGASRGIGRAIALRLVREGARVRAVARNEALLAELESAEPSIRTFRCDVTQEEDVEATVRRVVASDGRVDVLVNNAGMGTFAPLEQTSYRDFLRVLEVNAGGTFLFCRSVVPTMKRQGGGSIINISSVVGVKGYDRQAIYGASKHAVMGLTKALAVELQPHGVKVHSICPGGVDTELLAAARPDLNRSELMRPEDVAEVVVFLLKLPPTAVVDNVNLRRRGSEPWF